MRTKLFWMREFTWRYLLSSIFFTGRRDAFTFTLTSLSARWEEGLDWHNNSLPPGKKLHIVALEKEYSPLSFLSVLSGSCHLRLWCVVSMFFNPGHCDWQAHYSGASNADEEKNWCCCDKYRPRTHYKVFNSAFLYVCVETEIEFVCRSFMKTLRN